MRTGDCISADHAPDRGANGPAALGSVLTATGVNTWYRTLRKPAWTPPDRVFGPVWTVLYALIGISGWLVRRRAQTSSEDAGAHRTGGGMAVIAALLASILACVGLSARVSPLAAVLLLPYLAWTTFAAILNGRIWQLNRK